MPDVVTLGEAMALLVGADDAPLARQGSFRLSVAGAESNVAVGVARLGGASRWIGRIGNDGLGDAVVRTLRAEGVDVRGVVDPRAPTGVLIRDHHASRPIEVDYRRTRSAGSRLGPGDVTDEHLRDARVLHVTGITAALSESARAAAVHACDVARDAGVPVSFDPNLRLKLWSSDAARAATRDLARRSRVVLAGARESQLISGATTLEAIAEWYFACGAEQVVIKDGVAGSWASDGGQVVRQEAFPARLVDPVGAGDAFAAAYLLQWTRGKPLAECLRAASAAGAIAVESIGDLSGLPSLPALEARMSGESEARR